MLGSEERQGRKGFSACASASRCDTVVPSVEIGVAKVILPVRARCCGFQILHRESEGVIRALGKCFGYYMTSAT